MSDNQNAVLWTEGVVPPESSEHSPSSVQGGQRVQAPALETTPDLQSANSDLESEVQVIDLDIQRTDDISFTDDLQHSGHAVNLPRTNNLQSTSDRQQAVAPILQNPQTPTSLQQDPTTIARPVIVPDAPGSWTVYFRDLPKDLPRINYLLAGFGTHFHPSASLSDYLVRIMLGDIRGGPVTGAGMNIMALYGLRELDELEILNRVIQLDLSARFYRRTWLAMKNTRVREAAVHEVKLFELEAEKESYRRLKDMYEAESIKLEQDRSRVDIEMDQLQDAKEHFGRIFARLSSLLDLGMTIEDLQSNHDLITQRLQAILESSVISNTSQLRILSGIGILGGMQQWQVRFLEILQRQAEDTISAQPSQSDQSQTLQQSPLANQLQLIAQSLVASEAQLVEQQASQGAVIMELEADNVKLRKQVEDLNGELEKARLEGGNKVCQWISSMCIMM